MALAFKKATKEKAKGRIALIGPAGAGKTYSALSVAASMGGRIAVIDTEHGSASKYADVFSFDVVELESHAPVTYIQAIRMAEDAGYDVLVIDSLSHAWMGRDGALEQVDAAAKKNRGNSFAGWRDVTPQHNALVEAMISARLHVIVTMRSKTEWLVEEDSRGKKVPKKVGLAPIQKDGLEYEFDVVGDIDLDHNWIISKTRCPAFDGKIIAKPGKDFAAAYSGWLGAGVAPPPPIALVPPPAPAPAPAAEAAPEQPYRVPRGPYAGLTIPELPSEYLTELKSKPVPSWLEVLISTELRLRETEARNALAKLDEAEKRRALAAMPRASQASEDHVERLGMSALAQAMQATIDQIEAAKRGDPSNDPCALENVDEDTGEVERKDPLGLNGDATS